MLPMLWKFCCKELWSKEFGRGLEKFRLPLECFWNCLDFVKDSLMVCQICLQEEHYFENDGVFCLVRGVSCGR